MGDSRASIKIEFTIYGETDKADMWINYDGLQGEVSGVDDRIVSFFRDHFEKAYHAFRAELFRQDFERTTKEREDAERREYERLKAIYSPTPEGER